MSNRKPVPSYAAIARTMQAIDNCRRGVITATDDKTREHFDSWLERHTERIRQLTESIPSSSGFNSSNSLLLAESNGERLTFRTSFHHMNEHGYYDGWTSHGIIVKPSLAHGIDLRVTGVNRNDIKEYIGEVYHHWLMEEIDEFSERKAG